MRYIDTFPFGRFNSQRTWCTKRPTGTCYLLEQYIWHTRRMSSRSSPPRYAYLLPRDYVLRSDGSLYAAGICGVFREWSEDDRAVLEEGCDDWDPCEGECDEFQVNCRARAGMYVCGGGALTSRFGLGLPPRKITKLLSRSTSPPD